MFFSKSSFSYYSKSQIFVQKFNFDKKNNIFKSFSSKIVLTIFLVKSKLSTAKKPKTTTFSRVFHQKKNRQLFWEIKVEFLDKNEDFEQCILSPRFASNLDSVLELMIESVTYIHRSIHPSTTPMVFVVPSSH